MLWEEPVGYCRHDLRFFPIRDSSDLRKLVDSIKRGGVIVFEHFLSSMPPDLKVAEGMIGVPAQNELLKTFADLHVIRYEEVTEIADWDPSGEPASLVSLLAKKR